MRTIGVKTPAKINLTLEILNKREDGYHNIESIMQAVSLYDYISISIKDIDSNANIIEISGNNLLIPYDKSNLAYISAEKFLSKAKITNRKINIYIEKNIPVAAGLAGGSSNSAGVLFGLNKLFDNVLDDLDLLALASEIGSDVSFCLYGGTKLATGRGEYLESINTPNLNLIIAKPKNLFISAKEAYQSYVELKNKPVYSGSKLMIREINKNDFRAIANLLNNNLEKGILEYYPNIVELKNKLKELGCVSTLMSGSGPSVFGILEKELNSFDIDLSKYDAFQVKTLDFGAIQI